MGFFSVFGKITEVLGHVGRAVGLVETLANVLKSKGTTLSGSDKQSIAAEFVRTAIVESELFIGKEIADEDAFTAAVNQIIDGVVAAQNALKG